MRDMVNAATDRPARPAVIDVKDQRRVDRQRRVQARCRLPGLEADACHRDLAVVGHLHRHDPAVADDGMALWVEPLGLHLQPFDRGIDEAHRAADRALLAHHMPRFQRLPQFQLDAGILDLAAEREAEFELRVEPFGTELKAVQLEVVEHVEEIRPDMVRQHEAVMQRRAPAHEAAIERALPERAR